MACSLPNFTLRALGATGRRQSSGGFGSLVRCPVDGTAVLGRISSKIPAPLKKAIFGI